MRHLDLTLTLSLKSYTTHSVAENIGSNSSQARIGLRKTAPSRLSATNNSIQSGEIEKAIR